jgi:hypothetical protein
MQSDVVDEVIAVIVDIELAIARKSAETLLELPARDSSNLSGEPRAHGEVANVEFWRDVLGGLQVDDSLVRLP